jgi:hypothetical protein
MLHFGFTYLADTFKQANVMLYLKVLLFLGTNTN